MKYNTTLGRAVHRELRCLATTLRPATMLHYRAVAAHFLRYLERRFGQVRRPDQLRRDPHILGWMEDLAQRQPPLGTATRLQRLLCLRRLLEGMADLPHPPRPSLIRSEDLPRCDFRLPRPLSFEDDQLLQQGLRATNDLLANALLLQRATGLRIGELADLSADCLHHIGDEHWAIRVPVGKLHSERWVPVDQGARDIVARLKYLSTLPPARPDPQFLLPRPRGRVTLITQLRYKLHCVARAAGCSIRPVPHQLRHTFATEMMRYGVSLPGLMKLLGHTTPRMTMCYVQITQADLQREYLKAQSQPRHSMPVPTLPAQASADPASVLQALRSTLHLLDCSRQNLGYPKPLDALRRRLLKVIAAAERTYRDKIDSKKTGKD
jgi:site-specific recombinase XerD